MAVLHFLLDHPLFHVHDKSHSPTHDEQDMVHCNKPHGNGYRWSRYQLHGSTLHLFPVVCDGWLGSLVQELLELDHVLRQRVFGRLEHSQPARKLLQAFSLHGVQLVAQDLWVYHARRRSQPGHQPPELLHHIISCLHDVDLHESLSQANGHTRATSEGLREILHHLDEIGGCDRCAQWFRRLRKILVEELFTKHVQQVEEIWLNGTNLTLEFGPCHSLSRVVQAKTADAFERLP
mmetsp:Transcript_60776/g.144777  ORF Transcript_60776/g.144777 Transcript_60776/m.144777 type:complete len:235 (+) Transcript_60776:368-1072(+)